MLPRPSMCTHHYIVIDNYHKGCPKKPRWLKNIGKQEFKKWNHIITCVLNTNDLIVGTIDTLTADPLKPA